MVFFLFVIVGRRGRRQNDSNVVAFNARSPNIIISEEHWTPHETVNCKLLKQNWTRCVYRESKKLI